MPNFTFGQAVGFVDQLDPRGCQYPSHLFHIAGAHWVLTGNRFFKIVPGFLQCHDLIWTYPRPEKKELEDLIGEIKNKVHFCIQ